jgi:hypothetical protein
MSSRALRWAPYGLIAALAIAGQYLAGVEHLHPQNLPERIGIGAVAVGIEAMAIWLSVLARQRARLGEQAKLLWCIAATFAGVAVCVNIIGHSSLYLAVVFGGFSLAGFVIWANEQIALVRHAWDPDGKIRAKVPAYAHLRQFEPDDKVIRRARRIAQIWAEEHRDAPQGLGPVTVLELARQQLAEDERRAKIQRVMRTMYRARKFTPEQIELALLAYDTELVAGRMIDGADNAGLALAMAVDIRPDRLTDVTPSTIDRLKAAKPDPALSRTAREPGGSRAGSDEPGHREPGGSRAGSDEPGHREPGGSRAGSDEPVEGDVIPRQAITAGRDPAQGQTPKWLDDAVRVWINARAEGREPVNRELAEAAQVSLATLKRYKIRIHQTVIELSAADGDAA